MEDDSSSDDEVTVAQPAQPPAPFHPVLALRWVLIAHSCCVLYETLPRGTGCPSSGNGSAIWQVGGCCLWTTALHLFKTSRHKLTEAGIHRERKGPSHVNVSHEK